MIWNTLRSVFALKRLPERDSSLLSSCAGRCGPEHRGWLEDIFKHGIIRDERVRFSEEPADPVAVSREGKMGKKATDGRFAQADREALITLGAYALYFLWWYVSAYGPGDGDPANYSRIMGMPSWFFFSCIVGYPLITLLLWGLMRLFFRDMPLDEGETDAENAAAPAGSGTEANAPVFRVDGERKKGSGI